MRFRFGNLVGLQHLAIGANQHRDAGSTLLVGAFGCTVGQCHGTVGIAQQIGSQTDIIAPGFQIVRRAKGNPQYDGIFIGIVLGSITEPIGLFSSIIAEGAGVEPEQDVLARVIREADVLPVLIGQGKGRRRAADRG